MDRAVYLENDLYPELWSEWYLVLVDAIKERIRITQLHCNVEVAGVFFGFKAIDEVHNVCEGLFFALSHEKL
jgi:hypothetical protein